MYGAVTNEVRHDRIVGLHRDAVHRACGSHRWHRRLAGLHTEQRVFQHRLHQRGGERRDAGPDRDGHAGYQTHRRCTSRGVREAVPLTDGSRRTGDIARQIQQHLLVHGIGNGLCTVQRDLLVGVVEGHFEAQLWAVRVNDAERDAVVIGRALDRVGQRHAARVEPKRSYESPHEGVDPTFGRTKPDHSGGGSTTGHRKAAARCWPGASAPQWASEHCGRWRSAPATTAQRAIAVALAPEEGADRSPTVPQPTRAPGRKRGRAPHRYETLLFPGGAKGDRTPDL
jgi:hypothetical protein